MLGEMVHLEEISDSLGQHTLDPFQLPPASLQALLDVKATCSSGADHTVFGESGSSDIYYGSSVSSGSCQWPTYRVIEIGFFSVFRRARRQQLAARCAFMRRSFRFYEDYAVFSWPNDTCVYV